MTTTKRKAKKPKLKHVKQVDLGGRRPVQRYCYYCGTLCPSGEAARGHCKGGKGHAAV